MVVYSAVWIFAGTALSSYVSDIRYTVFLTESELSRI